LGWNGPGAAGAIFPQPPLCFLGPEALDHLGVSVVAVTGVDGTTLHVHGLDAIDGTPVLDIKPYLPEYDAFPEATIPGSAR
jgi:hypothetical protein